MIALSPSILRRARLALRTVLAGLVMLAMTVQPVMAQSILRDAETEQFFADIAEPIIRAAGLEPRNVKIVLIHDKEINAFVAGGQIVYIHSGLVTVSDNANQVQGVIAHELGHVTGGHIIRMGEGVKAATGISLLSLIAGIAVTALGGGEAGMGIIAAGQQAAIGKFLAFTRTQESSADAAGATFLAKAGISGRGSIQFFKKLQNVEFRLGIPQDDSYGRTHPLSGERISILQGRYEADPAWNTKTNAALDARFLRIKAKLTGFVSDAPRTFTAYPESDTSVPARYARAYAWHKSAYPDRALGEVNTLLKLYPSDPYFLELKGQILLESGKPTEALPVLREAVQLTGNQPLIAGLFGHALIATEDKTNYPEAERVLKAAVQKDNDNPFAWYQLGVVYDQRGDRPRAALATAERYSLEGRPRLALVSAEEALRGIPEGTPDWIRAQDIAMVSRDEVQREKKRK